MEAKKQLTGLRKRQQIQQANKSMFMWVAIAAVAISLCFVAGQFLVKQGLFNQKVINAKADAASTLSDNLDNAQILKQNVDALVGNSQLSSVKAYDDESNLQVVLDALPTENDSAALAASLQHMVLDKSGVKINNLSADAQTELDEEASIESSENGVGQQGFSFEIQGNFDQIMQALKDLERTIRPINLQSVNLQGSDDLLRATVSGISYYQLAKSVEVKTETIRP